MDTEHSRLIIPYHYRTVRPSLDSPARPQLVEATKVVLPEVGSVGGTEVEAEVEATAPLPQAVDDKSLSITFVLPSTSPPHSSLKACT